MTWFALQSLFLILGAFVLGVVVGWLGWGRQERQETIVVLHGDGTTPRTMTRPVEQIPVTAPAGTMTAPAPPATAPAAEQDAPPPPTHATDEIPVAVGTTDDADDGAEPPDVVDLRDATPHVVDLRDAGTPADDAGGGTPDAAPGTPSPPSPPRATRPPTPPERQQTRDAARPTTTRPPTTSLAEDDLERIEGITPKIAAALYDSGIHEYAQLAACDEFRLRGILRSAGLRFSPTLPSWPEQAELLAEGDDEGFAELAARVAADRRTAGTA